MIGRYLGQRYQITGELGRGGLGVVYKAVDPLLRREVAIKMIPPGALAPEAEQRFEREAQLVAQLDHPALVPIHDLGRHDQALFVVMPLVQGETLAAALRRGRLRLPEVLAIGSQLARGLGFSHARGVVHRDVKPSNVMLSRHGEEVRARLFDFGLALGASDSHSSRGGALAGSLAYSSPEQVAEVPTAIDGRADLYSLAAVLYQCLAGEPPFTGPLYTILHRTLQEMPVSLQARGVELPEDLDRLILACLSKDPAARPQTGEELAEALERFREALGSGSHAPAAPARVLDAVAAPARRRELPLIGRDRELGVLQERLQLAFAGEGQVVLVAGEAGTGKTRLLHELESLARPRPFRVLRGRFAGWESALPYQAYCELVQDYFRHRETTSGGAPLPELADLAPDLVGLFPLLAEVAELRAALDRARDHGAAGRPAIERRLADPAYVFDLLARTLTRLADDQPMVLLIEHLHAGEGSLEPLQYLIRRLSAAPFLFVATYRPSEVARGQGLRRLLDQLAGDPRCALLSLGALTPAEVRRLAEAWLGSSALAVDLVERLHEATEGNPLFCLELLKNLADAGGLQRDADGLYGLGEEALPTIDSLPSTLQQAEERRLDRLEPAQLQLLQVASVLGKTFDLQDLEQLTAATGAGPADGDDLEAMVDALVDLGLLAEDRKSRGDRLGFVSGILRDLVYDQLSRRRRRALHKAQARYLERRFAGRLERVLPQLVHHCRAADLADEAVRHGLELATRTLSRNPEDALRTARAALGFVEEEGVEAPELAEARLREILARAEAALGHAERAQREAEHAALLYQRLHDEPALVRLGLLAAEVAWQGRRMDLVRQWAERSLPAARRLGPPATLRRLLSLAATVAHLRGEAGDSLHAAELRRLEHDDARRPGDPSKAAGGRLVCALAANFETIDPAHFNTIEEWEVAANVCETLLAADADGVLVPGLCLDWQAADDGRAFVFELRPGLRFGDGSPADAAAIRAAIERTARRRVVLPPAIAAIEGIDALRAGAATLAGLATGRRGDHETLTFRLREELPIFPALLTDLRTAIAKDAEGGADGVIGTGPFRVRTAFLGPSALVEPQRVLLERNPHWRFAPPLLEELEFRCIADAAERAEALRRHEVAMAHDLEPAALDALLREPGWRAGLVEATKKNVYFALFNLRGPLAAQPALRRALLGALRVNDLVWRTLGRFAVPATSLVPPGTLGHDAGRRLSSLEPARAAEMLAGAGLPRPLKLRTVIHPLFRDRFAPLLHALSAEWAQLGVELEIVGDSFPALLEVWQQPAAAAHVDLLIARWAAAYDDPDNFTYNLFHGQAGMLRNFYGSAEADALLERARREERPATRQTLYQRFEDLLTEESAALPLFHEIDYRLAAPEWRGVTLRNTPPYVGYAEIGRAAAETAAPRAPLPLPGGEIHVPTPQILDSLYPAAANLVTHHEIVGTVFETLSRLDDEARIRPGLAESCEALQGGRAYRFRLRRGLRFHDGRRVTARDVRYSFERLLQTPDNDLHFLLLPILGARALADGEAQALQGFRIVSPREFVVELHRPLAFFPALLTHPGTAIVPEDATSFAGRWRDGVCGTGPFRVVGFEPGERIDLERNPGYWEPTLPRCDRLVFHRESSPAAVVELFRRGRLSLAADLLPSDVESLRRAPEFRGSYHESPSLSIYYLALNARSGPLADRGRRAALLELLDVAEPIRDTLGRHGLHAHGLVPPGLLGYEAPRAGKPAPGPAAAARESLRGLRLRLGIHPAFQTRYAPFRERLLAQLESCGIDLQPVECEIVELSRLGRAGGVDLVLGRWIAVYPDTDCFMIGLLDSKDGALSGLCSSPELDRLIEKGRLEPDPALRHTIYRRIEELNAQEHLVLPLFHAQTYRFAQPGVQGLKLSITVPEVRYDELFVDPAGS